MAEFNASEAERLARVLAASTTKTETMEAKAAVQLRAACEEVERLREKVSDMRSEAVRAVQNHVDSQAAGAQERIARREAEADRDRLAAELQAVKDERDELHRTLKAVVDFAIDECGMPTSAMLGSDAPLRVMRRFKQDRDSYANSDFERQLDEARAETTRLMSIIGLSMSPGTAESLARLERMRTGLVSLLERWEADDNTETVKAILSEASDIAFHVSETIAEPFREAVENEAKERP